MLGVGWWQWVWTKGRHGGQLETFLRFVPWEVARPSKERLVHPTFGSGTLDTLNGDSELQLSWFKDSKEMWYLSHTDFVGRDIQKCHIFSKTKLEKYTPVFCLYHTAVFSTSIVEIVTYWGIFIGGGGGKQRISTASLRRY